MSKKESFKLRCPCCNDLIEVDPERRQAIAVSRPSGGGDAIADALRSEAERVRRAGDAFERAKDDWSKGGPSLDGLLEDAAKRARKRPDPEA